MDKQEIIGIAERHIKAAKVLIEDYDVINNKALDIISEYDKSGSVGDNFSINMTVDIGTDINIHIIIHKGTDQYDNICASEHTIITPEYLVCTQNRFEEHKGITLYTTFESSCRLPKEDYDILLAIGDIVREEVPAGVNESVRCKINQ